MVFFRGYDGLCYPTYWGSSESWDSLWFPYVFCFVAGHSTNSSSKDFSTCSRCSRFASPCHHGDMLGEGNTPISVCKWKSPSPTRAVDVQELSKVATSLTNQDMLKLPNLCFEMFRDGSSLKIKSEIRVFTLITMYTAQTFVSDRTLRQCSRAFRTSFRFDCIPTLPGRRPIRDELRRGSTACGTAWEGGCGSNRNANGTLTGITSWGGNKLRFGW